MIHQHFLAVGAVSSLSYSQVLYLLPISLFGISVAAAELPELSRLGAEGRHLIADRLFLGMERVTFYVAFTMAMYIFAKAIAEGQPIRLFNHGHMRRDFTYVDDVVEAVERVIAKIPEKNAVPSDGKLDPATSAAPWRIYNIGNNRSVDVPRVVALLEHELGRKAKIELLPMQPGDVPETCADIDDLMRDVGFRPTTLIEEGVKKFVEPFEKLLASLETKRKAVLAGANA